MVRRLIVSAAGLAVVAGSLALSAPAMASSAGQHSAGQHSAGQHRATRIAGPHGFVPGGLFRQAPGTHTVMKNGRAIQFSSNWSGYAITGTTFTTTTASWTQPAITCSGSHETDMSPWVGIDGYSTSTVEQTGSSGDCDGSSKDYYAWYEMYPRNVVVINKTVKPGDQFTGTVTHTSGTNYTLKLQDITQGWTNSVTKSISAKDASAEAVMEMAANFLTKWSGPDPFTGFTANGQPAGSYSSSQIQQMEIDTSSGTVCDTTSGLTSNENFNVTWDNAC
ncbi:MAG TPA: G1 family glutamic endopeptidase [Streptosporangiaceae bacterium]|nr:G1 family glutamic endopeptidase [Streptosporangiaceae bacterium]